MEKYLPGLIASDPKRYTRISDKNRRLYFLCDQCHHVSIINTVASKSYLIEYLKLHKLPCDYCNHKTISKTKIINVNTIEDE